MISVEALDADMELDRATKLFPEFRSPHEGYAIILEELDELWDLVKTKGSTKSQMKKEAIQVAAMAMRFVRDLC